jgi:glucose/arabinose dehydrogenase
MRVPSALLAALLALGVGPVQARATDQVVSAAANTFLPASVMIDRGARLTFANGDLAPHNVVADATTRRGPLFFSATVTAGQTADVQGVSALAPATYTFHCSVHPQMHGSLTVTGGTGVAVAAVPTGGNVPTATSAVVRDGGLYVTSYVANAVLRLPILPGGLLGPAATYATGFSSPLGLAFAPDGWLYVTDSHQAADGSTVGRISTVQPGGGPVKVLVDNLPNGRHNTNGLAIRGGRLYVANGSSTDDGVHGGAAERPLSGTVLSYALPIHPGAKPTVEVRGLRNVYDLAFRGSELWFASNGPDELDPYGEDLLHRADVARKTADFGFPACVYKAGLVRGQNPNVTTRCTSKYAAPARALGLHVSADGVAFGTGGVWGGDLYVAEYGSNDPSLAGHRVVRIPVVNGKAGVPQDVVVGPAPLDVAFGPDGLYVLDFDSGAILLLKPVG